MNVQASREKWMLLKDGKSMWPTWQHCFHKHQSQKYKHPDLNPAQIKKDENDV